MLRDKLIAIATLCVTVSFIAGCGSHDSETADPPGAKNNNKGVVNLLIWSDFLAPDTIASFEKSTGIRVRVSYSDQ
jgi:spermidine/putrescine-binding protein